MTDFGVFSGLKCNLEKSVLMPIGTTDAGDPLLNESGFTVADSVPLLGFKITNNLANLTTDHEKTIQKIRKIINFWNRFGLSLPGRINIAKSLLLSQINYVGSIIMSDTVQLKTMNKLIEDFVVGKINVSKSRLYLPSNLGGLGLIRVEELLKAQQVNWVRRAHFSSRDNWRVNLKILTQGNCLLANPASIPENRNPVLRGISQSFSEFLKEYNLIEGNLKESFLINNPVITRGDRDTRLITFGFFQDNVPRIPVQDLLTVRIQDIADENLFLKRKDDIELPLSLITYMRLQAAFHLLRLKLRSMVPLDQTGHT